MAKSRVGVAKFGPTIGEFGGQKLLRDDMRKEAEELIGQLQEKLKEEILGTKKVKRVVRSKKRSKSTSTLAVPPPVKTGANPKEVKKVSNVASTPKVNTANQNQPKEKKIQVVKEDSTVSLFKTKSKLRYTTEAQKSDTNANVEFNPVSKLPNPLLQPAKKIKSILHKPKPRTSNTNLETAPNGPEPAQLLQVSPTIFSRLAASGSRSTNNKQVSFSGGVKGGSQPPSRPESQAQIPKKKSIIITSTGAGAAAAGPKAKKSGSGLNIDKKSEKIKGKGKVPPKRKTKTKGPMESQLSFQEARVALDLADTPVPILNPVPVVAHFEQGKPMYLNNQNAPKENSGIYVSSSKDLVSTTSGTGTSAMTAVDENKGSAVAGKKKKVPKRSSRVKRKTANANTKSTKIKG